MQNGVMFDELARLDSSTITVTLERIVVGTLFKLTLKRHYNFDHNITITYDHYMAS